MTYYDKKEDLLAKAAADADGDELFESLTNEAKVHGFVLLIIAKMNKWTRPPSHLKSKPESVTAFREAIALTIDYHETRILEAMCEDIDHNHFAKATPLHIFIYEKIPTSIWLEILQQPSSSLYEKCKQLLDFLTPFTSPSDFISFSAALSNTSLKSELNDSYYSFLSEISK